MYVWNRYEEAGSDSDGSEASVELIPVRTRQTGRNTSTSTAEASAFSYDCSVCNKNFKKKGDLKSHKDAEDDHHYCRKCDRDFATEESLKLHRINSNFHIVCTDCDREFESSGGLARHREQMHKKSQEVHCPGCLKPFRNVSGLVQHVENDLCEGGLKKHVLQRKVEEANHALANFNISDETPSTHVWHNGIAPFNKSDSARESKAVPAGGTTVTGSNNSRGISFLDYTNVGGESSTKREFEMKWTLEDVKEHYHPQSKSWKCPYARCQKKYPRGPSLVQHLNSPAHEAFNFRCPKCLKRFQSSSSILQHVESNTCGIGETSHAAAITRGLSGNLVSVKLIPPEEE